MGALKNVPDRSRQMILIALAVLQSTLSMPVTQTDRLAVACTVRRSHADLGAPAALTSGESLCQVARNVPEQVHVLALPVARFSHPHSAELLALGPEPIACQLE